MQMVDLRGDRDPYRESANVWTACCGATIVTSLSDQVLCVFGNVVNTAPFAEDSHQECTTPVKLPLTIVSSVEQEQTGTAHCWQMRSDSETSVVADFWGQNLGASSIPTSSYLQTVHLYY